MDTRRLYRKLFCFLLAFLMVIPVLPGGLMRTEAKGSLAEGDSVKTIFLYGVDQNGEQMLLAQLSVSEMLTYLNDHFDEIGQVHNYSVIDRYPTTVHQEAQGFTVQGLLDYAAGHSGVSGLNLYFEGDDTVSFWEIDGAGYDEADTYSYQDLYEVPRYNFPLLYKNYNMSTHVIDDPDTVWSERQPEEALLSITAFSERYMLTDEYNEGSSNLENSFDSRGLLDTAKTMRLMLPMTQEDFEQVRSTASSSRWGICNILLRSDSLADAESAGTVAKPVCSVIDGDADPDDEYRGGYSYFALSCPTEGASIYYNDNSVGSYVPSAPYTPGQLIEVKKTNGAAAVRVRAVKDGYADAGIVTLDDQSAGGDDVPEGTDTWDGSSVDTSWYTGHENDSAYTITTCAQLAGLAELINDGTDSVWIQQSINDKMETVLDDKEQTVRFAGKTVRLGADLNLAGHEFEVIGDLKGVWQVSSRGYRDLYQDRIYAFDGTFDGGGHTIYGLNPVSLDGSEEAGRRGSCGLFGCVEGGVVRDLTVRGLASGSVENGTGGIAGRALNSQFINCVNYAKVTTNPAAPKQNIGNHGGIAGKASGCSFTDCTNYGEIGYRGRGIGDGTVSGCRNYGSVQGVGIGKDGTMTGCANYGNVTEMGIGTGTITGCDNRGTVDGSDPSSCAGIGSGEITECLNTGSVSGTGIGSGTLRRCVNAGPAVCGLLYTGEVYDSCNIGETTGGSIACGKTGTVLMSNCYSGTGNSVLEGFVSGQVTVGSGAVYYPTGAVQVAEYPGRTLYKLRDRSISEMTSARLVSIMNQAAGEDVFKEDTAGVHGGFPLLAWESGAAFETGDGSAVPAQILRPGELVSEPEPPVLEGSRFTGWYTDPDGAERYDFSTAVTEPIRLYAVWKAISYAQPDPFERLLNRGSDPSSSMTVTWRDDDAEAGILQYRNAESGWEDAVTCQTAEPIRLGSASSVYWQTALTGLDPGTVYEYRVRDGEGWSDAKSFATADPSHSGCSFLYMGDVQHLDGSAESEYRDWGTMLKEAYADNPDIQFGLMGGDLVQSGSDASDWSYLLSYGSEVYSSIPMMPANGNHESNFQSGKPEWYLDLMDLPKNGPEGYEEEFYSFDEGGVHVTVLNSWALSDEQGIYANSGKILNEPELQKINEWIRQDLASPEALAADFRVVMMHHPAYSLAVDPVSERVLEQWVPILEEGAADLVLCGHQHVYSRSYPMYGGEVNSEKGITYVMGNAGQKYYDNADTQYQEKTLFNTSTYQVFRAKEGVLTMETCDREGNVLDTWSLASRTSSVNPSFRNQSLLLSGRIGVNFYMELPALEGVDYSESYMTFEIGHGTITERDEYDPGSMSAAGEYYGFTCYVNSIQMAEPITAAFHYRQNGKEKTVKKTYSVSDYFDAFDKAVSDGRITDETVISLVHSLADYGHYVQPFLADARHWTLGTDYAVMEKYYAGSYDMETIKKDVSSRAIRIDNRTGGDIETVSHSLLLDSDTEINVYFRPGKDFSGNIHASVDGGPAAEYTRGSNGQFCVKIRGISAHQLSKEHTVTVTTAEGRTATVTVSALSYVHSALNYYTDNQKARNAVAAIYAYSKAANAYKAAH